MLLGKLKFSFTEFLPLWGLFSKNISNWRDVEIFWKISACNLCFKFCLDYSNLTLILALNKRFLILLTMDYVCFLNLRQVLQANMLQKFAFFLGWRRQLVGDWVWSVCVQGSPDFWHSGNGLVEAWRNTVQGQIPVSINLDQLLWSDQTWIVDISCFTILNKDSVDHWSVSAGPVWSNINAGPVWHLEVIH